jgi:hypothetical protein
VEVFDDERSVWPRWHDDGILQPLKQYIYILLQAIKNWKRFVLTILLFY